MGRTYFEQFVHEIAQETEELETFEGSFDSVNVTPTVNKFLSGEDIVTAKFKTVTEFEKFSQTYIENDPKILFIIDYIVDGKNFGVLVVWKKYFDSTHYEIFKRNIFQKLSEGDKEPKFNRVLFLGEEDLIKERAYYIDYIKQLKEFKLKEDNIFIFHDPHIKEDRIYQYKIKAARVPKLPDEVDYDFVLLNQKKAFVSELPDKDVRDLYMTAARLLGNRTYSWMLALLNERLKQFSPSSLNKPILDLLDRLIVPIDYTGGDIIKIIEESVFLFGFKETLRHMVNLMGGLPDIFVDIFLNNVNESDRVFYSDKFNIEVLKKIVVVDSFTTDSSKSTTDFLDQFSFTPMQRELTLQENQNRLMAIESALKNGSPTFIDPVNRDVILIPFEVSRAYKAGTLSIPTQGSSGESRFTVSQLNPVSLPQNLPVGFSLNNVENYSRAFEYLRSYLYALINPTGVTSDQATESEETRTLEVRETGEQISVDQINNVTVSGDGIITI